MYSRLFARKVTNYSQKLDIGHIVFLGGIGIGLRYWMSYVKNDDQLPIKRIDSNKTIV